MVQSPLIVFLDRATLGPDLDLRRPAASHRWQDFANTDRDQVIGRLAGATVAVTNKVPIGAKAMAALPDLRLIAVAATGTDIIDKEAAAARGIRVLNCAGYGAASVADHVMMLMLALSRGLVPHRDIVLNGGWSDGGLFCAFAGPVRDLDGARLGLIGGGQIAQQVAQRARGFGMEVVTAERRDAAPRPSRLPFDEVLATADVLSLHCPLTDDTRGLMSADTFAMLKPGAFLINTARGALIDLAALDTALESGRIGGAGLDVAAIEPPPRDDPLLALARRPNVIVTPHAAWTGRQALHRLAEQLIRNVETAL